MIVEIKGFKYSDSCGYIWKGNRNMTPRSLMLHVQIVIMILNFMYYVAFHDI